jgi:hypothetical protein
MHKYTHTHTHTHTFTHTHTHTHIQTDNVGVMYISHLLQSRCSQIG